MPADVGPAADLSSWSGSALEPKKAKSLPPRVTRYGAKASARSAPMPTTGIGLSSTASRVSPSPTGP